ncbi:serine/threonine-protein kinase Pink1, mitochondrial-like [Physella acuta]|uniref:serine/threonine-protein kinase Pink1, mitochondrial-like n=1 Tax=Physella acuta TaxID=109671 RepID=UPI0027DC4311|nr:serine/threonine-protein kinase Pink1, mitochondrial-like [Physella acuta]
MPLFVKAAAGAHIPFFKGFGSALKNYVKDVLQTAVLRKKPNVQRFDVSRIEATKTRFLHTHTIKSNFTPRTRLFHSLFSRTTANNTYTSELRRKSALRLFTQNGRNFRNVPIMSLIGVTLGLDVSGVMDKVAEKMMANMRDMFRSYSWQTEPLEKVPNCLADLDINLESIANGCEGAVYKAKVKDSADSEIVKETSDADFDLAVKAVFNYGAESNSQSILRELEREIVPLRSSTAHFDNEVCQRVNRLPPHPNIVDMPGIFVDDMLVTEEGLQKFPAAMPQKLDPGRFFGRSKTLYLVMRRRNTHLRDYLANNEVDMRTRCLMLAQLLEGVSHLRKHGIAHRDLKSDNILVDVPSDGGTPRLEICDFGCCLAEENKSMRIPFHTRDLYMGGNSWLMAPELVTETPGPGKFLDFCKSDLWAVGAIAYEIFGAENPFYPSKLNSSRRLKNVDYKEEELPPLPEDVPLPIKKLVRALLIRNPKKRPSASVAAAVVHMAMIESTDTTCGSQVRNLCQPMVADKIFGKSRPPSKLQVKLNQVLFESLTLLCQLTFSKDSETWDIVSVMNFLFLSQLTYADFKEALKFF